MIIVGKVLNMSANNYTICPQCYKDRYIEMLNERKKLKNLYGNIPPDEFIRKTKQLENLEINTTLKSDLREDYEIGTNIDGFFYMSYKCSCDICHFTREYKIRLNWFPMP